MELKGEIKIINEYIIKLLHTFFSHYLVMFVWLKTEG